MRILILLSLLLIIPNAIHAQDNFPADLLPTIEVNPEHLLKGGEYQLELSPLEEHIPTKPETPKIIDTRTAQEREQFASAGYIIRQKEGETKLSLSSSRMSLGSIARRTQRTGTIDVIVSTDASTGYELLALQTTPTDGNWPFPQTRCNSEDKMCTLQRAAPWEQDTAYGFGYNLIGKQVGDDFKDESYFRAFSTQYPLTISRSDHTNTIQSMKMNIKLHTSPETNEAIYSTNVSLFLISK